MTAANSTDQEDGPVHAIYRKVAVGAKLANGEEATKEAFEKYTVYRLDGVHATKNFPQEYSWLPWPQAKPSQVVDLSPPVYEVRPELLPDQATAIVEARAIGPHGHPIAKGTYIPR